MGIVEKAISWMENAARDNSHGYDQIYRWGEKGDYDCSSAVITAWQSAGIPVKTKGATYTGNMRPVFLGCGFKDVTSQVNRVTGAGLIRGDVLLNIQNHVAMYCGNGKEVEASINEKGTATGGQPGDQTGYEFLIRSYRNYPWDCVLRYPENTVRMDSSIDIDDVALKVIEGAYGDGDERIENLKKLGVDYSKVQARVNEMLKEEKKEVKKEEAKTTTKIEDSAESMDEALAGYYVVTASALNMRSVPGSTKPDTIVTVLMNGAKPKNYGYYTEVEGTKWLLMDYNGKIGFVSEKYLMKL